MNKNPKLNIIILFWKKKLCILASNNKYVFVFRIKEEEEDVCSELSWSEEDDSESENLDSDDEPRIKKRIIIFIYCVHSSRNTCIYHINTNNISKWSIKINHIMIWFRIILKISSFTIN